MSVDLCRKIVLIIINPKFLENKGEDCEHKGPQRSQYVPTSENGFTMTVVFYGEYGRAKKVIHYKVRFDFIMITNESLILRHLTASTLRIAPVYFYSSVSNRKDTVESPKTALCEQNWKLLPCPSVSACS